jgi:hypothetical protein
VKLTLFGAVIVALFAALPARAQDKPVDKPAAVVADKPAAPAAPGLSAEQKRTIQVLAGDAQAWAQRQQEATQQFNAARATLASYIAATVPDGYQLNDALELMKKPAPVETSPQAPAKKDEAPKPKGPGV